MSGITRLLSILAVFNGAMSIPFFAFTIHLYWSPEYYHALFQSGVNHVIYWSGAEVAQNGSHTMPRLWKEKFYMARSIADEYGALLSWVTPTPRHLMDGPESKWDLYVNTTKVLFETYPFDGINFDWEYPEDIRDCTNYGTLLKKVKEGVHRSNRSAYITMDIGAWEQQFDCAKRGGVVDAVDMVLMMTYDNIWDPEGHSSIRWTEDMFYTWRDKVHLPVDKLAVGIPLYGSTRDRQHLGYKELVDQGADPLGNGFFNGSFFNTPAIIRHKTQFIFNNCIGGIMIYALEHDYFPSDARSLMQVFNTTLDGVSYPEECPTGCAASARLSAISIAILVLSFW
ncbi:hypothetical protein FOL47_006835 [Perkinsus chesapeaki]|uniref:GH18 domain-containing protein n=1 Tax=Perkinsus chesapeaki TaxID=330153 RepID=A0A7J6LPA2_PERCH|nr:hypothetical protein FOL47_006835 [Perkinsus chesapeaki]